VVYSQHSDSSIGVTKRSAQNRYLQSFFYDFSESQKFGPVGDMKAERETDIYRAFGKSLCT
jgi:hypothetical protein